MSSVYARIALLLLTLFSGQFSFSQTDCGFDEQHKRLLLNDPAYKASVEGLTLKLQQMNEHRTLAPNAPLGVVYRIPVVVHVIHRGEAIGVGTNISDAQIQSAIVSLTQFYRGTLGSSPDAEIEFELASLDPSCTATTGIIRVDGSAVTGYSTDGLITGGAGNEIAVKNLSKWTNTDYYNIWIVSEINNNNGGGGVQGFAYFPPAPSSLDGAVMLFNAFGYDPTNTLGYNLKTQTDENKTAIHELGHAFSLYHSFEGDDANFDGVADQCPLNTTCGSQGDQICDTDPHRRSLSNCPSGVNICGGILDNTVKNFMDYSSAACQDRFTIGQITRMRDAIALYRSELTTSRALTTYPATPYITPVATCASNSSATALAGDYAGIMNIGINGKNFSSLTPRLDNASTGYLNWTTNCQTLNELVRGGTYLFSVTVYAAYQEQLRAWIDYNNNGIFDNITEQIFLNSSVPSHPTDYVTVSGWFTVPGTAVLNTVLRLRVVEEIATVHGLPAVSDACYDPTYGQAEDFPIYLSSLLPITLKSFTGKKSGDDVLLSWQTSSEQNAREYEIEKSFDGVNFSRIGTVPVKRSLSTRQYSFMDRSITRENNYYRLRLVDMDGHFEYSKIVTVKNPGPVKPPFTLLSNPVRNSLDIQFAEVAEGKVQVRLSDITGKTLITWNGENIANQKVKIDVADKNLSKGIYILHVHVHGRTHTEKVIIK